MQTSVYLAHDFGLLLVQRGQKELSRLNELWSSGLHLG